MANFTLAHLSDLHLGPLPEGCLWRQFAFKRLIGGANWFLFRQKFHQPSIVKAMIDDIRVHRTSHIAVTGDIVNIAAAQEFPRAARWLRYFNNEANVTFVPGNHDCYVSVPWEKGLKHLAPWMSGEMHIKETQSTSLIATAFPFVRLRKNIALIGLSSALPQSLWKAGGSLGEKQLDGLKSCLPELRNKGYYRVVLIHHPPLPGLASPRKSLSDADHLQVILEQEGAELILHGHNHRHMLNWLGNTPIVGVPSASFSGNSTHPPSAWVLYEISRQSGQWRTEVKIRNWNEARKCFVDGSQFLLSP